MPSTPSTVTAVNRTNRTDRPTSEPARQAREAGREFDERREPDHACSVNHAHGHRLLIGIETAKLGLGADHGEGLAVDRRTVGFEYMGHQ